MPLAAWRGKSTSRKRRLRGSYRFPAGFPVVAAVSEHPQATGVLFIITQQVQPSFTMQLRHSQQAWIISLHLLSPEVYVMQMPLSVISHLHIPMVRLQQQTIIPFIMQQQLHIPPCSMVQRFCIMLHAI
jgi:hypothetical protein